MKKGLIFSAEFLLRLVVGIAFAALIVMIGCSVTDKLFNTGAQDAQESFSALLNKIENLDSDKSNVQELQLIQTTAVVGFAKNAAALEFLADVSQPANSRVIFQRPSECQTNLACLCYCVGYTQVALHSETPKCNERLSCTSLKVVDFPAIYKTKSYGFRGGFYFASPVIVTLERKGNVVTVCEQGSCLQS